MTLTKQKQEIINTASKKVITKERNIAQNLHTRVSSQESSLNLSMPEI
jgi:hypothetical protein